MTNELINIINTFNGYDNDDLYKDLILINKSSAFNEQDLKKFIISYMALINEITDIKTLYKYWSNLNKIEMKKIYEFTKKLQEINPYWIGISHPKITKKVNNQKNNEESTKLKIYLSIDNNSIHQFANIFLLACLTYKYEDFDFKINNNSNYNRRDNVVIYCTDKTFKKYANLIQEIIQKNPQIMFNQPHLLGIQYKDNIYYGCDFNNETTSYTDKLCQIIFEEKKKGNSPQNIINIINEYKQKNIPNICVPSNSGTNFPTKK